VQGVANSSSGGTGVLGTSTGGSGVHGKSASATGLTAGVYGEGTAESGGYGVLGTSAGGVAVGAISLSGVALDVLGRAQFGGSGTATIAAGQKEVSVDNPFITAQSLVLATMQQVEGNVAVLAAVPADGSVTVHLTAAPAAAVQVGWFAIG
jgi:hypothetical protein